VLLSFDDEEEGVELMVCGRDLPCWIMRGTVAERGGEERGDHQIRPGSLVEDLAILEELEKIGEKPALSEFLGFSRGPKELVTGRSPAL